MVFPLNLDRVRANAQLADTEDLLDRVTVYREGMEPEALDVIEAELRARGVRAGQIEVHAKERRALVILLPDGTARPCSFCHRPAIHQGWGWHHLGFTVRGKRRQLFPLFPRYFYYCDQHYKK